MNNNKLYTLSYFRKRLLDEKIKSKVLVRTYTKDDNRYWTISMFIDLNIFCTCFRVEDDVYFEFWDGTNNILNRSIRTKSMQVIITSIKTWVKNASIR